MPASTNPDDLYQQMGRLNDELRKAQSLVDGWTRGGTLPNFEHLTAVQAEFVVPPLELIMLERTTTQTLGGADWTDIQFTTVVLVTHNCPARYDTTAFVMTFDKTPYLMSMWLFGRIEFESNSSGKREFLMSSEALIPPLSSNRGGMPIARSSAASGGNTVLPVMFPARELFARGSSISESSFASTNSYQTRFQVYQNATLGNVPILNSQIGFVFIYRGGVNVA